MLNRSLRTAWDRVMTPVGEALGRSRIHPDAITLTGVVLQAWAAYLILDGALAAAGVVGGVAGILDAFDGLVARARGIASRFGAFLDSTVDRVSDALVFGSLAWLYGVAPDIAARDRPGVAALALTTLVASSWVSYVKARAESLGFACNVGVAQRAERLILIDAALILDVVPAALGVLAALSVITFVHRIAHVRRQARRA